MKTVAAQIGIPAKWRWHYEVLCSLRDRLLDARQRGLHEAGEQNEWRAADPADSASDEFERDLTLTLLSSEMDALYEVEAALSRIKDGSYGICEMTGKPVPAERLRAVPWTRYCRTAAEELLDSQNRVRLGPLTPLQSGAVIVGQEGTDWEDSP